MSRKRQELQEELHRIEQKCLRPRGFAAKENAQEVPPHPEDKAQAQADGGDGDRGRKRDKFAMDVDEKERDDSDGEERHEGDKSVKEEKGMYCCFLNMKMVKGSKMEDCIITYLQVRLHSITFKSLWLMKMGNCNYDEELKSHQKNVSSFNT